VSNAERNSPRRPATTKTTAPTSSSVASSEAPTRLRVQDGFAIARAAGAARWMSVYVLSVFPFRAAQGGADPID
jgi:hypothetical protein